MSTANAPKTSFEDSKVDTKIKLAALWAAATFCYIYGDYFELYVPGKLGGMLEGKMQPLGLVTQEMLLGTSVLMAIPSVMVFLSLVIRPSINRWINIVFGTLFTAIMLLAIQGSWTFYKFFGVVEIALTATIVWYAWKWPRSA
ncbi:MAG TPA: DUF6326 family protein [Burkholderiales bacterium]|nr:DUF6326 family protein [Burkholderiales bacterium]